MGQNGTVDESRSEVRVRVERTVETRSRFPVLARGLLAERQQAVNARIPRIEGERRTCVSPASVDVAELEEQRAASEMGVWESGLQL